MQLTCFSLYYVLQLEKNNKELIFITSSSQRKQERLNSGLLDTMSTQLYNLILGGCILYGLLLNVIIVIFFGDVFAGIDPRLFLIGYFVLCFGGIYLARSGNPMTSFLGYNLVVLPIGALLSVALPGYAAYDIRLAIVTTACIVAVMITAATLHPEYFAGLGTTLFFSLLIGVVVELIAMLLGYEPSIFNWAFVLLFTLYIGYDWYKAQAYPKTLDNAIDSALDIYLDIINLFIRILNILNKKRK